MDEDHQGREKPIQAVEAHGHKKQHRKRQHKRDLMPRLVNGFSLLADARRGDKRTSIRVSGKMKNPPMTTAWIDALGLTHVPSARIPAKLGNRQLSPKPANVEESRFSLSVLNVHSNLQNRCLYGPAALTNKG